LKHNFFIIGGGLAGLSAAYVLLQHGQQVTLADKGESGQSSWAGAGILCPLLPWNYDEAVNRLALGGMRVWPEWTTSIAKLSKTDPEYWACGMEILGKNLESGLEWCKKHEFPAKMTPEGTLLLPNVAQVRNPRLLHALKGAVIALGGKILSGYAVSGVRQAGGKIKSVVSGHAEFEADSFIWAGGAWTGLALEQMAPVPNIQPIRGQMLLYPPGSHDLDRILYRDGLYLVPRRDGHLLAGSTTEKAGFKPETVPSVLLSLREEASRLLPALRQHQPIRSWAGLRPGSPDNIPIIGRHPDYENFWVHTGHFRYGVTMAPVSSRLLVEMMLGQPPHIEPSPYSWAAAQGRSWPEGPEC